MRLVLVGSTLLLGVGAAGMGASVADAIRPANVRVLRLEEVPRCEGICGLTPTENAAELAESTVHNGQELPSTY